MRAQDERGVGAWGCDRVSRKYGGQSGSDWLFVCHIGLRHHGMRSEGNVYREGQQTHGSGPQVSAGEGKGFREGGVMPRSASSGRAEAVRRGGLSPPTLPLQ